MELLQAIAADLRVPSIQPPADDPTNVYGKLLRHLASSQRPVRQTRELSPGGIKEIIQ
jgi:hypothetical protein